MPGAPSKAEDKVSYSDYCALTEDFMTYRIDEEAMAIVTGYGYPRNLVIESINRGDVNHATAAYYLLVYQTDNWVISSFSINKMFKFILSFIYNNSIHHLNLLIMASEVWSDNSDSKKDNIRTKSDIGHNDLPSFYSSIRKMIKGFKCDNPMESNEKFLFNGV